MSKQQQARKPDIEKHYRLSDVVGPLGLSYETARVIFRDEPGVKALENKRRTGKREYRTLLIPESVLNRVLARLEGKH